MGDRPVTRLILVRHGESQVTVDRVLGGAQTCSGLSELGRRQAAALRDRWASGSEPSVDALWASTLPRAIETAEVLNPALGDLPLKTDVELEEMRPGDADGTLFADFEAEFGAWSTSDRYRPLAPNGDSIESFHYRVGMAIDRVAQAHRGQSVLISCHGGVIDVVFRDLLRLPTTGAFDLWTLNTSITELVRFVEGDGSDRWRLVRYNDTAHLAGLPKETPRGEEPSSR